MTALSPSLPRPADRPASSEQPLGRSTTTIRRIGWGIFGAQLAALLAFSTIQYQRYALTKDFAERAQAWAAIGHGHLNPFSSVLGMSFWRDEAEFVMWPLALLHLLIPSSVVLLWVQDLALVATEVVAFGWVLELLGRFAGDHRRRAAAWLAGLMVVATVANPWVYETLAFDFHTEVLAGLFIVLGARSLWAGRTHVLWFSVPLALLCSALSGLYVAGLGLSGLLAGRATRRIGLLLAGVGIAWVVLMSAVGGTAAGGQLLDQWYGYLLGPQHHGPVHLYDVVVGAVTHPSAGLQMVARRAGILAGFLVACGLLGVASPWALGMVVATFVPAALNASPDFLRYEQAFQVWPALPFVAVGTVMVLERLARRGGMWLQTAKALGASWVSCAAATVPAVLTAISGYWLALTPPAASLLARADSSIPKNAEVIVTQGISGRFGPDRLLFPQQWPGQTSAVRRHVVYFVLAPSPVLSKISPQRDDAALVYVRDVLGAAPIGSAGGVYAFAWRPPAGVSEVTLP